ncbi:Conserved_hypothetical protein [Hexamita inflata]|uniref:Uncharacterized protein n=1 Tax=Hexamita inflata TaxID=28002 RepID=A0AA86NIK3_9EUKA|nr:Conserved hypothetical protein [Hexamita inflata]
MHMNFICDSASCGIKAHQLLNGLVKNLEFEQIRNTQLASSTHPVLLRCAAHVGNLFLQDYCRDWNVWSQIQSIAVKHNVRAVMCATRWTSCLNAAKKIKKWIPPGSNLAIDVEIVRLATKYIQFVEADRADAYVLFQQMNQLKTELIRLNNERSRSMLANIEAREQKYHTTHDKIGQFLLSLDPQNPNTDYETFRTLCEQMASKFSKNQLKGNNPVQFYEQLISIEKAEQAVEYLRTSPNGKTDYIDYLFNIWHTNPVIRDTLSIIRALTINSASLERLFSFFHRQTASFLRGSINKETLIKMGIIYREIMQPEIQRWKQQQLINKLIDKRKGISISEQLMHWNEF